MKYTKENLEGAVVTCGSEVYKITNIHTHEEDTCCRMEEVDGDWFDEHYYLDTVIECLEDGSYTLKENIYEIY